MAIFKSMQNPVSNSQQFDTKYAYIQCLEAVATNEKLCHVCMRNALNIALSTNRKTDIGSRMRRIECRHGNK